MASVVRVGASVCHRPLNASAQAGVWIDAVLLVAGIAVRTLIACVVFLVFARI